MLSWLTKKLISFVMARTRAGDIKPTLLLDAGDVRFVFPGDNSWSGEYLGKDQHRTWLERLVRVGVKTEPDEVAVSGFPWRMTVCIRGRSWLDSPEGERIYDNRFVIWGKLRWGKLYDYEVYEDTQKAKALDGWLEQHEQRLVGLSAA
jgi:ketosteroid isomerase-like protein